MSRLSAGSDIDSGRGTAANNATLATSIVDSQAFSITGNDDNEDENMSTNATLMLRRSSNPSAGGAYNVCIKVSYSDANCAM